MLKNVSKAYTDVWLKRGLRRARIPQTGGIF